MKAKTGFNRFVSIFLSVAIAISALAGLSLGGLVSAAGEENTPMHIIVHLWHTVNIDGKVPADGSKDEVVLDGYFWKKGEGSYSFNGSSTDPTSNTKPAETSNVNRYFSESSDTITIYSNVRHEGNKSDGKALENYAGFSVSAGHTAVDMTDEGNNSALTIQFNENVHLVKVHIFYTNTSMYVAGTNNENELVSGTSSVKFEDDRDTFYAYIDGDGKIIPVKNSDTKTVGTKTVYDGADETIIKKGAELTKYYNTAEGLHTDKTAMETAMAGMGDGRTFDLSLESWFVGNRSADIGLVLDASGSMVSPSGDMKAIRLSVEGDLQKHFGEGYQLIDENGFLLPEVVDYILDPAMTDSSSLGVSGFKYYLFDAKTSNNDFFPLGYWNGEDKGTDEVTIDGAYTYDIPARDSLIGYYPFIKGQVGGGTTRTWLKNGVDNKYASVISKSESTSVKIESDSSVKDVTDANWSSFPLSFNEDNGLDLLKSKDGMLLELAEKLNADEFTLSFVLKSDKNDSANPQNQKEILYIGSTEPTDSNYFRTIRDKESSSGRLKGYQGAGTTTMVSNLNHACGNETSYITYVYSEGKLTTYAYNAKDQRLTSGNVSTGDNSPNENKSLSLSDDSSIVFNAIKDSYDAATYGKTIYVDEIYVYNKALDESQISDIHDLQKNNKNIEDINAKSTITTGGDVYLAKSGDNVLGTIQKSVYNEAKDSDSPMRGWYYVSFGSDWDNYFSEVVGTAKDYRHVYGPASVYENDAEKKKGEKGRRYDLVYRYDEATVTGKPDAYKGVVFYHKSDDCYVIGDGHEEVKSEYTLIDGRTLEDHPGECRVSFLTYRPTTGSGTSDDNPSPIKFFIDKNGNLCCFFATGRSDKDMDGSYGWSYVFEKDDDAETKVESLQKALGSFTSGLFEGLPSSKVSAVRFSSDKVPMDTDSDKLVLLDWTNDPVKASEMLALQYGEGSSTSSATASEGGKPQYNYGLTGGTTTQYGIQAYIENLKKAADEDKNAEKYLIIFTDGKDTDLSVKAGAGGKVTQDDVQAAIKESEAYKKLKTLKEDNYTVFCVMLTGGVMNESTSGEIGDYEQALQFLVELSSDGGTYSGVGGKYPHVFVGDGSNLTAMFDAINEEISADLENYTVQDYIDPRFDLVDAAGNVWNLNADGAVTCGKTKSVTIYQKGEEATDSDGDGVIDADSDGDKDVDGDGFIDKIQADATKLDKNNYAIINLPNSNNEEGTTAKLYFDNNADTNMYYLVWDNQDIPSCVKGDTSLKVWNATVTVRAKDDFIGGNAVTTNGNSADQNYVYMNGDENSSSGTDRATVGYDPDDPTGDSYPSKGFPRTTVNVAVPSLVLTGGEQVIYMGEELTPDGVAEKLGETILDKWATVTETDKSGTQWYWEYLDRYAKYNRKDLEDIIKEIVAAEKENDEGSITYPYFYIPRYDEDNKLLNQTGSFDHHEKDQLGTLKFTWTTVDTDGSDYPNDNKGGTTVDTDKRVSTLTVQYIPLQADDGKKGDDTKDREDYIKDIVQTEEDSGEDVYPWDSDYKPAPGQNTYEEDEIGKGDNEDDHIPMDSDSGKYNRLASEGSYTTNIVRGQINLDWEDPEDVLDDLINFFPNETIKYTADLYRSYNGKETKVGTFAFNIECKEAAKTATHEVTLTLDEAFKELTDEDNGGLPIGEYYIKDEKTTIDGKELSCLSFTAKATAINAYVAQFAEDIYKHAPEAAAAITSDDITKYAAPFSDVNIQLGYNKTTKEKTDENYTDDLLGMYIASPTLLKGDLSITKNVIDKVNSDGKRKNDGKEFTFNVTLEGVSGSFTAKGGKYGDGTTINGTSNGDSTVYTITVRAGEGETETVTIEGIPAGTKYTVKEVDLTGGYSFGSATVDSTEYKEEATVSGTIPSPKEGAKQTEKVTFTNIYQATGTVKLNITKKLEGRNLVDGDAFKFKVTPDEATNKAIKNGNITMSSDDFVKVESEDGTYYTITVNGKTADNSDTSTVDGSIIFNKTGDYSFTVSEENGKKGGITYDSDTYELKVTVKDERDGELTTLVSYGKKDTTGDPETEANSVEFTFINTYTPEPVTWKPSIDKQIDDPEDTGRDTDWQDSDSFTFEITLDSPKGDTSVEMPESKTVTISNKNSAGSDGITRTGSFGEITFTKAGDYTFTIKENGESKDGIILDVHRSYKVTVTVSDDSEGTLSITNIAYEDRKGTDVDQTTNTASTSFLFINTHKHEAVNWKPTVSKDIDGRDWKNGEDGFDFTIELAENQEPGTVISTVYMPSSKVAHVTEENKSVAFKAITFTEIGVYKFIVTENDLTESNGLAKDEKKYTVTVTVENKPGTENELIITEVEVYNSKTEKTETYTAPEDVNVNFKFTNIYSASGTIDIPVSKNLEGRAWKSTDSFTFEISTTDKNVTIPADSKTVTINGIDSTKGEFTGIEFTEVGTYTFTIKESQEPKIDHITYSTEKYTVEVTVKDQGDGTLDAEITKVTDKAGNNVAKLRDGIIFTNTYKPDSVTWTPYVSKTIVDEDDPTRGENWLEEVGKDTFTFTVSIAGGKNYGDNVVMPKNAEVIVDHTNHTSSVPFDSIKFTKGGIYEFVIEETEGTQDGIIYDHTKYNVTVEVSDDTTNGTLSIASVTYKDREGNLKTETGAKVNVTFPFVNKHHHDAVKLDLSAQKKLTGRDWHGDEFTFTVTQDSSDIFKAHMPTPNTATVSGPNAVEFSSDITFTEVGEYHFTVKENELSDDVKKYITPVVSEHEVYVKIDDHDGKLYISEMKIDDEEVTDLPEPSDPDFEAKRPTISHVLEFKNKYSAKPAKIQIPVSKVLDGRKWTDDDSFTFTISPDTYSSTKTITIQNTGDEYSEGDIKGYKGFFDLTFDLEDIEEVNEFTFTISENSDSPIDHITYSKEVYTVTVKVTDDYKGKLTAEITEVTKAGGTDNLGEKGVVFTNTYTPKPVTWTPSVTKEIRGRSEWNPNYSFGFTITPESTDGIYYKDSDGNEQPYTAQDIFINSETSDHTESFKTVIFRQKGKYTFTVKETVPAEAENNQLNGITYDGNDHKIVVTVIDNEGQLEISTITVDGKDVTTEGKVTTNVTIINTYSANGSWPPIVEKSFDTRNWDDSDNEQYTFVLSLEKTPSGVDKSTVNIPNDGTITISGGKKDAESVTGTFGDVGFTKPGTYEFKLTEESYNGRGVTSATTEYIITVNVTDNGNGTLAPTVSAVTKDGEEYNGTNYEFVNTYDPDDAEWTPGVQKTLEGANWNGYTFIFSITLLSKDDISYDDATIPYAENDVEISSAAENTKSFNTVTFTEAGKYKFKIAEVVDDGTEIDNIVYDGTPRFVTVEVVDHPDTGELGIKSIMVSVGEESYTLDESDNISFTNYYTDDVILKVKKELDTSKGRDWFGTDGFSFTLTLNEERTIEEGGDVDNVIMPESELCTAHCNINSKIATFGGIGFKGCGTYVFNISEDKENVYQGVTYDYDNTEYEVIITVEEVTDETDPENPVTEIKTTVSGEGVENDTVTFTNTAYDPTDASVNVKVQKTLEGKEWEQGDSFRFKIEPKPDEGEDYGEYVVMPTETEISISADTLDYTASFGGITFKKDGKYTFTISEVLPEGVDSSNWTYAEPQDIEVEVTYDKDTNSYVATIQGSDTVTVEFTNKYTSPSTPTSPSTDPTPPTDPTPSTPTQPTTSEDTSAPEQTTGPEETTPEETTSEETTASSEESTVPSEETTPDTTDSEEVSENDGYNTNVDGDGDKNMNTGVPFGSAIMMCALSSLAVAVAVRKKKNGRNDK